MSKPYTNFWPKHVEANIRLAKNEAMLALERIIGKVEAGDWSYDEAGGEMEELADKVQAALSHATWIDPNTQGYQEHIGDEICDIQVLGKDPREGLVKTKTGSEETT